MSVWRTVPVRSADEAAATAAELGYPVVVKSTAERLRHQRSVTSIRIDLGTESAVREAYQSLREQLVPAEAGSIVMQRMASQGVACVVSSTEDPVTTALLTNAVRRPPALSTST